MQRTIKISSVKNNVCKIEYFLNSIFHDYKFERIIYCKMYLAVTEAIINSIMHGNKNNQSLEVELIFDEYHDKYIFTVQDQGAGFDYKKVKDPTHPKNIRNESGRGIFIMKQYADKVFYENNGSRVILTFNKL